MKYFLTLILAGFLLFVVQQSATAQAPPPPPGKPQQTPVDGGLAILAVAGGGYAIKKLREKNQS